jgi:hypothetical protein
MITSWVDEEDKANAKYDAIRGKSKQNPGGSNNNNRDQGGRSRMDLPGPTTSVGTRTDYSVGPWDYPTCVARYLMA